MDDGKNNRSYHIPQWKIDEIKNIIHLIKSHKVSGVLSFSGILGNQLQKMRKSLHGTAIVKVARNNLIEKAISSDVLDPKIYKLKDYISSQTALIFTNENPFKLFKLLEKTKTPSPIKAGSISNSDIYVEKGPTSFPPGPILGELQSAGIPVGVESGKIAIKESKLVCKSGEKVSQKLATALSKLEIYPLEVGLILNAAYESGTIFERSDLNINIDEYINNITYSIMSGMNLSINASYPTNDTIINILGNAHLIALNMGINCSVLSKDTISYLISNSVCDMISISIFLDGKDDSIIGSELKEIISKLNNKQKVNTKKCENNDNSRKEENSDHSEEDGMAGLGALFG